MIVNPDKSLEVGLGIQFDFTGTPREQDYALAQLMNAAIDLGGVCIKTQMDLPSWERQLDRHTGWLLEAMPSEQRERAANTLYFQGLDTCRSLLVMGEERLLTLPNIGREAIISVRNQLDAAGLPVTLKSRTTIEDMAALCRDPGQIPLQVLMPGGFNTQKGGVAMREAPISIATELEHHELFEAWGVTQTILQAADQLVDDFWGVKYDGKVLPWSP